MKSHYDYSKKSTVVELPEVTIYPNNKLLDFYKFYFPDKTVRQSLYNAENTVLKNLERKGYYFTTNALLQRLRDLHQAAGSPLVYDWNNQDETLKRFTDTPYHDQQEYNRTHDRQPNGSGRAFTYNTVNEFYKNLNFGNSLYPRNIYSNIYNRRIFDPVLKSKKSYIFIDPFPKDKSGITTLRSLIGEYSHPVNDLHLPGRYHVPDYNTYKTVEEYNKKYDQPYDLEHMTHTFPYGVEPQITNYGLFKDVTDILKLSNSKVDKDEMKVPKVTGQKIREKVLNLEPILQRKLKYPGNEEQFKTAIENLLKIGDYRTIQKIKNTPVQDNTYQINSKKRRKKK